MRRPTGSTSRSRPATGCATCAARQPGSSPTYCGSIPGSARYYYELAGERAVDLAIRNAINQATSN
ncbi:hypothetical protein ACIQVO_36355 [Streptomyces sp. NPDC101062]|uniref:hypothetical protein n=1 Tax=unclassified Streptomyces TaxID=2593676 RepID=UPI003827F79F